jgi:uncharacterized membrane protein (DUF106 family)
MDIFSPPGATFVVMLICMGISFLNGTINRLLISRFIGLEEYRMMQKEMAEFRRESTQAVRSKDTKLQEKLKKRQGQIMQMQKKMMKPQMILFVLSFGYILVWLFGLTPLYAQHPNVAYMPGFGPFQVTWWYFICSFLFGTIASRVLGTLPIE